MGPKNTVNEPFVSNLFDQFDNVVCRAHVSASGVCQLSVLYSRSQCVIYK